MREGGIPVNKVSKAVIVTISWTSVECHSCASKDAPSHNILPNCHIYFELKLFTINYKFVDCPVYRYLEIMWVSKSP